MRITVSIDPSIEKIGYAVFLDKELKQYGVFKAKCKSVNTEETGVSDEMFKICDRLDTIYKEFPKLIGSFINTIIYANRTIDDIQVVVEHPDWQKRQGRNAIMSLFKLCDSIGVLFAGMLSLFPIYEEKNIKTSIAFISVKEWKQFIPKNNIGYQAEYLYGIIDSKKSRTARRDDVEAVMIGHHYINNRKIMRKILNANKEYEERKKKIRRARLKKGSK